MEEKEEEEERGKGGERRKTRSRRGRGKEGRNADLPSSRSVLEAAAGAVGLIVSYQCSPSPPMSLDPPAKRRNGGVKN